MKIWPGKPYPLGATWDGFGVNFALFSEHAEKVELCLFDSEHTRKEILRLTLPEYSEHVWHVYLPGILPGQVYGYRVYGEYDPQNGLRFNPQKVMLDPYAKSIVRSPRLDDSLFSYRLNSADQDLSIDKRNNAMFAPLGKVVDTSSFDWGQDEHPNTSWNDTVIYETHVRGMTKLHPDISSELRGTFAGLASEPIIKHLKRLGITAVELMPIHAKLDEKFITDKGLSNYWGYSTLSYFSPELNFVSPSFLSSPLNEFRSMVKALHAAKIEVILDVVYNHTCEGNHLGPMLSLKGIDNLSYYRVSKSQPRFYVDYTGCGNTLNTPHPRVLQLIMDSLRYWVIEAHVDGFRFDLASTLARESHEVDKLSGFFDIIHQDPVLSRVKLIAEPWDLGDGGYQVGNFPVLWSEWNAKYRDNVRKFWKGDTWQTSEFATRITGSSDLFSKTRRPTASINFITCHDGFSLEDLVSYNYKHNEANLEGNNDGNNDNFSWNCGKEGYVTDKKIKDLRMRQKRNLILTLFCSLGVPMICGGDEMSQTHRGNNNPYCQDNEINWLSWKLDADQERFLQFVSKAIELRKSNPVLRRREFYRGLLNIDIGTRDLIWLRRDGKERTHDDWINADLKDLAVCLLGSGIRELSVCGERISGDTLLIIFNSHFESTRYTLPHIGLFKGWEILIDTVSGNFKQSIYTYKIEENIDIAARSIFVLKAV